MVSTYQPKNGDWGMVYCVFLPHQIAVFARRSRIVLGSQNVSRLRDLKKASSRGCITSQQVWEVFLWNIMEPMTDPAGAGILMLT
jgi:hypothetical protein